MWNNAGLSTSILITACPPANGMVHHTVAKIFVSTKLRDLGPKSSAIRTFWRMVAACIQYQPLTEHLLRDLTTFSLASVRMTGVSTSFLGLAYPPSLCKNQDDNPELPQVPPICTGEHVWRDITQLAISTPLPPVGILEAVLLSLKEGEALSESTLRRLRRKEAEIRAAAAEGRNPVSEYKRRKLKKIASKVSALQVESEQPPEEESPPLVLPIEAYSPPRWDQRLREVLQATAANLRVDIPVVEETRYRVIRRKMNCFGESVSHHFRRFLDTDLG